MLPFPLMLEIIIQGWNTDGKRIHCIKGIPPDAKLVKAQYENFSGSGMLVFEHPTFEDIGSTGWPEKLDLEFEIT